MSTDKNDSPVGSSDWLGRAAFSVIARPGSTQYEKIRDEMRRLRVQRDACLRGLSEAESDFLYKHSPRRRIEWERSVPGRDGATPVWRPTPMARITSLWDDLRCSLGRIGCTSVILLLRLLRRLQSFWFAGPSRQSQRPKLSDPAREGVGFQP